MKRTKRVKPEPAVVMKDLGDVDRALKEIAELKRELAAIDRELDESITEAKRVRDLKVQSPLARVEELENGIYAFSEYNRDELFARRKSRELVYGTVGYRQSTKISVSRKTLARLEELGLSQAIIVTRRPNRNVMLQWPEERLREVHAKRVVEDNFWYELKQENLSENVARRK